MGSKIKYLYAAPKACPVCKAYFYTQAFSDQTPARFLERYRLCTDCLENTLVVKRIRNLEEYYEQNLPGWIRSCFYSAIHRLIIGYVRDKKCRASEGNTERTNRDIFINKDLT